jgi:DegV family protein with EDD domain
MMEKPTKFAIVTDSSCDLIPEQIKKHNIHVIPLRVVCSQGEFRDQVEISQEELYALMEQELPKTSLPLPEDVSDLYERLINDGVTHVLHLCISAGLSGTYNMIRMVTKEFESRVKITLLDSRTLSTGLGMLVLEAAETLSATGSMEAAVERVMAVRETQLGMFIIKTLEFLRKGGRIGLVEGVVGTILQLKPIIFVNPDGVYQTLAKARGYANALDTMVKEAVSRFGQSKIRLSIVHGAAAAEAQKLLDRLKELLNLSDSFIAPVSPVLAIHTGPGLLGIVAHEV